MVPTLPEGRVLIESILTSILNGDVVFEPLHAGDFHGDFTGAILLAPGVDEPAQLHIAFECDNL